MKQKRDIRANTSQNPLAQQSIIIGVAPGLRVGRGLELRRDAIYEYEADAVAPA